MYALTSALVINNEYFSCFKAHVYYVLMLVSDSNLDITKHLVRMNDNGLPTIQVTFEPVSE